MKITPLSSSFAHTVHTYHGVCPWNRDGSKLVYLGFTSLEHPASVVVRDVATGTEHTVGQTSHFNFHCAAWQHWTLNDTTIAYRAGGDEEGGRLTLTDVATGQARPVPDINVRELRHVTPDGQTAYATSKNGSPPAVYRINLKTLELEMLLTAAEAEAGIPAEFHDPQGQYGFSHPVPNAAQTHLFVKLERKNVSPHPNGMSNWGSFLVLDLKTRKIRSFGNRISGHPIWMRDDRHILNIKQPLDGSSNRWLVLMDSLTGEDRRLIGLPIEGPGHPAPSPDGQWVVTDAYTADQEHCPIYLIHVASGTARELARLPHRVRNQPSYDPMTILRANPHPVWSPDGTKVLLNCNHAGERMQLMLLEDFLRRP